jgi:hypothetical protein
MSKGGRGPGRRGGKKEQKEVAALTPRWTKFVNLGRQLMLTNLFSVSYEFN